MENWEHAEWTSQWVGGLPFILINLSCPLNVSGLMAFHTAHPLYLKASPTAVHCSHTPAQTHRKGSFTHLTCGVWFQTWKTTSDVFNRLDFQITCQQGFFGDDCSAIDSWPKQNQLITSCTPLGLRSHCTESTQTHRSNTSCSTLQKKNVPNKVASDAFRQI